MFNIEYYNEMKPMKIWGPTLKYNNKEKRIAAALEDDRYIASEKKDGHWYMWINNGIDEPILRSGRLNTVGKYPNKIDNVPHIKSALMQLPPCVLIGEVYLNKPGSTSNQVTSIMNCLSEKAIARQNGKDGFTWLNFYIHDVLFYNGIDYKDYKTIERKEQILEIESQFNFIRSNNSELDGWIYNHIEFSHYVWNGKAELLEESLASGGEGIVLIDKDSAYLPTEKTATAWLTCKVKKELNADIDCIIIGFEPPTKEYTGEHIEEWPYWVDPNENKFQTNMTFKLADKQARLQEIEKMKLTPVTEGYFFGWAGSAIIGAYKNEELVKIGRVAGLTKEIKQKAGENPDNYIGQVVTVSAMQIFEEENTLRHPKIIKWRDDKNAEDCLWEAIFE